jgi:hypothetical protein
VVDEYGGTSGGEAHTRLSSRSPSLDMATPAPIPPPEVASHTHSRAHLDRFPPAEHTPAPHALNPYYLPTYIPLTHTHTSSPPLVLSPFPSPSGIVTLEDILETLVGKIYDEADDNEVLESISSITRQAALPPLLLASPTPHIPKPPSGILTRRNPLLYPYPFLPMLHSLSPSARSLGKRHCPLRLHIPPQR